MLAPACISFQGFWEGLRLVDPSGIGTEPCPGLHWLWKGFPLVDIPNEGTNPYHEFQSPCEEGIPKFSPSVGIVPCIGFCCP
jgi:hypothetical protein